jgi:hypothetical protein
MSQEQKRRIIETLRRGLGREYLSLLPGGTHRKLKALRAKYRRPPNPIQESKINLVPAGFRLGGGKITALAGKPLAVLRALVTARGWRLGADQIAEQVWPEDTIAYREQAVKDAVSKLRKTLIRALRKMGVRERNPLPSTGRGPDLTYQLDLSALDTRQQ